MFDEDLRGRDVLVTGAAGFIGNALCARLTALGARVTGCGRSAPPQGFAGTWVRCDLTDLKAVQSLLAGCRPGLVFHMAGRTLGDQGKDAVWPTLRDNLLATVPLLVGLAGSDCRRIVVTASARGALRSMVRTGRGTVTASWT